MRTLALLLALVLAPQAALARVAAFPETALRGDREISAVGASASARQLADGRRETACFYDSTASAMTDDPINHRDPTGRATEWEIADCVKATGLSAAECVTKLTSTLGGGTTTKASRMQLCFGGTCVDQRTRAELDVEFVRRLEAQAAGIGCAAALPECVGGSLLAAAGVAVAGASGVKNRAALEIVGTAGALVGGLAPRSVPRILRWADQKFLPQFEMTGVLDSVAQEMSGTMPNQFPPGLKPGETFERYVDGEYGVFAELEHDGMLNLYVKKGPSTPAGGTMFSEAYDAFRPNVRGVRGTWLGTGTLRANYDAFHAGLARGLTPEAAASATFTGKMAARYGFSKVSIVSNVPGKVIVEFMP